MKYSILMPYHKRSQQLESTLWSLFWLYVAGVSRRHDFEVIVAEDYKNASDPEEHQALLKAVSRYSKVMNVICFEAGPESGHNPAVLYNLCAERAQGQYLLLTNPEGQHAVNILGGLDTEFEEHPDAYVICSCLSVDKPKARMVDARAMKGDWYQHSVIRNIGAHFCSCLSAQQYRAIGGFDNEYRHGYCFDDDDFRNTVIQAGIETRYRDDLVSLHLYHDKSKPNNYLELHAINKAYYENKWGQGAFRAEQIELRK